MKFLVQKVKNLKIYQSKSQTATNLNANQSEQKLILNFQDEICYLIYVGIEKGDEKKNLEEIVKKLTKLQIVDYQDKFSLTIEDFKPKIVFVSQITLLAAFERGRINFNQSLETKLAKKIFDDFVYCWQNLGYNVFKTDFGSYLEIESTNLGPVNFILTDES